MIDMLSGLKTSFAIPDQTEEFVTRVTEHCYIAKELECPQINIKSGKKLEGANPQTQFAAASDNLKHASDVAAKNGIDIVIEPIDLIEDPKIFLTSVKDGFEIVRAVNRPKYDFHHAQQQLFSGNVRIAQNPEIRKVFCPHSSVNELVIYAPPNDYW
jgi:hydroxypyruvate isomerase